MACDEDHDITILCVEIKEDEIGCELATIDGNRGLALSPVALGESYRRLHSLAGWSLDELLNVKKPDDHQFSYPPDNLFCCYQEMDSC